MTEIIIDAENAVLGRLSSFAAKQALEGKEVRIVNSEKAIIQGGERNILERYRKKRSLGGSSQKGPKYPSLPSKILKRTIRNMLPYKKNKGREALKKVRCYKGVPKDMEGKKMIKSGRGKKGISLDKISKLLLGGK